MAGEETGYPLQYSWASLVAQLVKNLPAMQESLVWPLGWEYPLEKGWLLTPVFLGFPCGSTGKESACNVGDLDWIPGLGRTPGEGKGYPLQYSGLENSINYTVRGDAKSRTQLSDFHILSSKYLEGHCLSVCIMCLLVNEQEKVTTALRIMCLSQGNDVWKTVIRTILSIQYVEIFVCVCVCVCILPGYV